MQEYINQLEKTIEDLEAKLADPYKRIYIPSIGTVIELSENWSFNMKMYLNHKFLQDNFNIAITNSGWDSTHDVVIPKNIHLVVRRIYIRQGKKDYDSVTFSIKKTKKFKGGKFWASLEDVNKIFFRIIQDTVKKPELDTK